MNLVPLLIPEIILIVAAAVLFLLGIAAKVQVRRFVPWIALAGVAGAFVASIVVQPMGQDALGSFLVGQMGQYLKILATGVGILFVLLSWPTNAQATGNASMDVGKDTGEFFGLMLLSLAGLLIVIGANDIIMLFMGIELASIPTYVMVTMSRPVPESQEAGVKYFFLGALSAAVMLFGFSYLYGTTGLTDLTAIGDQFMQTVARSEAGHYATQLSGYQLLAVVMLIAGFGFKLAMVPLHAYAGDVYQGAATPMTALISFVPKASGTVALLKVLAAVGGNNFFVAEQIGTLLAVLAVLTMTFGNVLGLLQFNVKRVLAYSSIAHSGYILVGIATLVRAPGGGQVQEQALSGVLFYLTAYGVMNAAALGVLMMLPPRQPRPTTTAETYEDIAGMGRKHPFLGLMMAISCFSLIGLPLTVGFLGKLYLLSPALSGGEYTLAIFLAVNAAISAAYYLKIIATMFLRDEAKTFAAEETGRAMIPSRPVAVAVGLSVAGTLVLGMLLPATTFLTTQTREAAQDVRNMPIEVRFRDARPAVLAE
ncbi:MAG: NADH-quinone oxidoreductase subunit N [Phycisphaerae bacterium]